LNPDRSSGLKTQSARLSQLSATGELPLPREELYRSISYRVATVLIVVAVAILYLWCSRSANGRFIWNTDLGGYYDLLGRGFVNGHLYLPVQPARELLQLADPWDPDQNRPYRLHDAVLYHRRYYLYHGAAPALVLFAPWRFVTGHDLPESFAALLFCLGGFLFSCMLFIDLLSYSRLRISVALFAAMLLGLGVAQSIPYLLQRVMLYEVAIASGYCFLMAGFCFFFKLLALERRQILYAALSGICFGIAVGCRPNLVLAVSLASLWLLFREVRRRGWRAVIAPQVIAFMIPLALNGIAIALYNYARFGNPFEFGVRYQLGDVRHPTVQLALANFLPGFYYFIACVPDFERIFPFLRLAIRLPFSTPGYALPAGYVLEPIAGCLALCPLTLIAFASPVFLARLVPARPVRAIVWLLFLTAASCILFIAGTGWATQRYEVDFLPVLLLIGCYVAAAAYNRLNGWSRKLTATVVALAILYSAAANLALAIQGPYDSFVQTRPASYARIARWLGPGGDLRPLLNPRVSAEAMVEFPVSQTTAREPLIATGEFGSRYALDAEKLSANIVRLTSAVAPTSDNVQTVEVVLAPGPNRVAVEFAPAGRVMSVYWNGHVVLNHQLSFLITAPAQIRFGEETLFGRTARFSGRVAAVQQKIEPESGR